uniref:Transmembrane protein n=1 Tax=Strongyloides venezuelensis TaxID=75913 RepID=A0A0K0FZK6_STRVS
MGSRITSLVAVIISLLVLIGAVVLFFLGFTDFKPESAKDLLKVNEAKVDTSKFSIIDVADFLNNGNDHGASIISKNGTKLTSGSLVTYPICVYSPLSLEELKDESKKSSLKSDKKDNEHVKFHIKPSKAATSTIDLCEENSKLSQIRVIILGTGIVGVVILSLIIIFTIFILFGFCSKVNIPMFVAIIGIIGFCSGAVCLGSLIYMNVNYYTLRGLESREVATTYKLPEQGNNKFYLLANICLLFSNLLFVIMMFVAARQRRREIVLSIANQIAPTTGASSKVVA